MKLNFTTPPAAWQLYPGILCSLKPRLLADGIEVPPMEARLKALRIDAKHLKAYAELCGFNPSEWLPLTYPHVLASGLHLALLSSAAFPVRLLGLVHVRNRIEQRSALRIDTPGGLKCSLQGHRNTERGQEFDLLTQWTAEDGSVPWQEVSTFLARSLTRGAAPRTSQGVPDEGAPDAQIQITSFFAPAGLGRSYGWIAGDLNPIHLSDLSAKLFGFQAAIAHGMWSMARCVAEFSPQVLQRAITLDVAFKLPVLLPSWLMFSCEWRNGAAQFALHDSQGQKPHFAGTLAPRS